MNSNSVIVVQLLNCPTLCEPMNYSTPGFPVLHHLPESAETHVNHLMLFCLLLLLRSVFPSIRVFSNELGLCLRWSKYWSFSISPSNEYSGLISFRIDWLDLPAVQGTLKSLPQHHSSKASILQPSAFFIVQLSHPSMTTGMGCHFLLQGIRYYFIYFNILLFTYEYILLLFQLKKLSL